jgi:hypothetical protein
LLYTQQSKYITLGDLTSILIYDVHVIELEWRDFKKIYKGIAKPQPRVKGKGENNGQEVFPSIHIHVSKVDKHITGVRNYMAIG